MISAPVISTPVISAPVISAPVISAPVISTPMIATVLTALLAGALAVAAVTDLRSRIIPDKLTVPVLVGALAVRALGAGLSGPLGLVDGLLGALLGGGVLFLVGLSGGLGGGDVKLMGAAGACLGLERTAEALVLVALAGLVQAVVTLVRERALVRTLKSAVLVVLRAVRLTRRAVPRGDAITLPYGVAIAAGCALALVLRPL